MLSYLSLASILVSQCYSGISIPQDHCRWLTATEWNTELKCDGNEVAVGACSGGGGWGHKDCPGGSVYQLRCCAVEGYYYSGCNSFAAGFGANNDCRDHGEQLLLEGSCSSGEHNDCAGSANTAVCCSGHLNSTEVGPTAECTWEYTGHGKQLECGRSDEIVVGRCGSGGNLDCPGDSSHGNLCCELDFYEKW